MQNEQIDRTINKMLYLSAAAIPFFQILNISTMVSFMLVIVVVLTAITWAASCAEEITGRDLLIITTILIAALNVFINASLEAQSLSFSYIRKLIFFALTLLCLQTATKEKIWENDKDLFYRTNTALSIFIAIMYVVYGHAAFMFNGIVTDYLVFNFSNPNLLGMYLGCIAMIEFNNAVRQTKVVKSAFHLLLFGLGVYFVFQTQSRNVVLALLVFIAASIVTVIKKEHKDVNKLLSFVIVLWPLIFAIVYMALVKSQTINELLSFLVTKGKDLDSRQRIWQYAISSFTGSPIIGAYNQISKGSGMFQLHNTGLDTLASYGIIPYTLTTLFLHQTCLCRNNEFDTTEQYICINAYFACLIMGIGEAGLFSGSLSYFVYVSMFLRMSGLVQRKQII